MERRKKVRLLRLPTAIARWMATVVFAACVLLLLVPVGMVLVRGSFYFELGAGLFDWRLGRENEGLQRLEVRADLKYGVGASCRTGRIAPWPLTHQWYCTSEGRHLWWYELKDAAPPWDVCEQWGYSAHGPLLI
jgi:hypothetical protein